MRRARTRFRTSTPLPLADDQDAPYRILSARFLRTAPGMRRLAHGERVARRRRLLSRRNKTPHKRNAARLTEGPRRVNHLELPRQPEVNETLRQRGKPTMRPPPSGASAISSHATRRRKSARLQAICELDGADEQANQQGADHPQEHAEGELLKRPRLVVARRMVKQDSVNGYARPHKHIRNTPTAAQMQAQNQSQPGRPQRRRMKASRT